MNQLKEHNMSTDETWLERVSGPDLEVILNIAERGVQYYEQAATNGTQATDSGREMLKIVMDLSLCHRLACKLDLAGLLNADNSNFVHDIMGIRRHLNRQTGQLMQCFEPRYAWRAIT
jgi:hypothetical protein